MRFLIVYILMIITLYADNIELNLKDFAQLVSTQHRINILIDDEIKKDNFSFFVQKDKNTVLLSAFRRMLRLKGLILQYDNKKFYYIRKIKKQAEPKKNIYVIKLKTLTFEDFKPIFAQFKELKYNYIKNSNSIVLICTKQLYTQLKPLIQQNDYVQKQFQLKLTIVETNRDDVKDRGVQINSYIQSNKADSSIKYFIDLLTLPSTASKNIFSNSSGGITASLHFLNSLGVSTIKSSPVLTVQSGKKVYFSSGQNIPYEVSSSSTNGASQTNQTSVEYKDVGLKIGLLPKVVDDICFIDLDFVIETVLSNQNNTPSVAKRELKNSFQLKYGEILVLSGLQDESNDKSTYGIPILMEAPLIGQMFRFNTNSKVKKTLSIIIQIVK